MTFRYDPETRQYLDSAGVPIADDLLRRLRNLWADGQAEDVVALVANVEAKRWNWVELEEALRRWIAATVIGGYLLGRGGRSQVGAVDILELGGLVSRLTERVERWLAEVVTERITLPQFRARMEGAAGSSVEAFDKGRQAGRDGLDLPYMPADGGTDCMDRCRCWWEIEEFPDRWEATWHTMEDNSVCEGCNEREAESNPYVQEKGG